MNEMLAADHPLDMEPANVSLNTYYPSLPSIKKEYRPEILSILERIQEAVNRWKMLEEPLIEQRDGWVIMTIGNVWRLARRESQLDIFLWEYCIIKRQWREVSTSDKDFTKPYYAAPCWREVGIDVDDILTRSHCDWFKPHRWPTIRCLQWKKDRLLSPWTEQAEAVINYVICKLGLIDQFKHETFRTIANFKRHLLKSACRELVEHYRNWAEESQQDVYAIQKALRKHFLDRSLMSALCCKCHPKKSILLPAYIRAIPLKGEAGDQSSIPAQEMGQSRRRPKRPKKR